MVEQTLPNGVHTNQADFFSILNVGIEKITPQIIEDLCRLQLDRKIQAGFHRVLGKSSIEYESDFEDAFIKAATLDQRDINTSMLVLVEPRIPVETQLALLHIRLDSSVFQLPPHEQTWTPYPVQIGIVDNPSGWTKRELIQSLPDVMRPTNLFEAINADLPILLKDKKSVIVPSLQKAGVYCLQEQPERKVELSYMRGFYGPEDSDSTDNNLYTRRRFPDVKMLASYLDKV